MSITSQLRSRSLERWPLRKSRSIVRATIRAAFARAYLLAGVRQMGVRWPRLAGLWARIGALVGRAILPSTINACGSHTLYYTADWPACYPAMSGPIIRVTSLRRGINAWFRRSVVTYFIVGEEKRHDS